MIGVCWGRKQASLFGGQKTIDYKKYRQNIKFTYLTIVEVS